MIEDKQGVAALQLEALAVVSVEVAVRLFVVEGVLTPLAFSLEERR